MIDTTFFPITALPQSLQKLLESSDVLMRYKETENLGNRITQVNIPTDSSGQKSLLFSRKIYSYVNPLVNKINQNSSLTDIVAALKSITSTSFLKVNYTQNIPLRYRTITEYKEKLDNTLINDGVFSWDECSTLDDLFGTDTLPVIFLTESSPENYYTSKGEPFETAPNPNKEAFKNFIPDNFIEYFNKLIDTYIQGVLAMDKTLKDILNGKINSVGGEVTLTYLTSEEVYKVLFNLNNPRVTIGNTDKAQPGIYFYFDKISDAKFKDTIVSPYKIILCLPPFEYTNINSSIGGSDSSLLSDLEKLDYFNNITLLSKSKATNYKTLEMVPRLETIPYDVEQAQIDTLISKIKYELDGDLNNSTSTVVCTPLENTPKYYVDKEDSSKNSSESLYYKRYVILNQRLNRLNGPLYHAQRLLESIKFVEDQDSTKESYQSIYNEDLKNLQVLDHTSVYYLPKSQIMDINSRGKFIRQDDIDTIRSSINDKCLLTCGPCSLKDVCPFYNEEELIKKLCPPLLSIELWFKDNELLLIDSTENNLLKTLVQNVSDSTDNTLSFNNVMSIYSGVTYGNSSEEQPICLLNDLESKLTSANIGFNKEKTPIGWLTGGRFGTVQENDLSMYIDEKGNPLVEFPSTDFTVNDLPRYSILNDTVFLEDTETFFNYTTDTQKTDVIYTDSKGTVYNFTGENGIKLRRASSFKLFEDCNPFDEVFLVSEDDTSALNAPPMICLGRLQDLSYNMDNYNHLSLPVESLGVSSNLELSPPPTDEDIITWNLNLLNSVALRGTLDKESFTNPVTHKNQNQFWMKKIYKRVPSSDNVEKFYVYKGRDRVSTDNIELVINTEHPNIGELLMGKSPIITYENFTRKVSFKIAEVSTTGTQYYWTIPWISPRHYEEILKRKYNKFRSSLPAKAINDIEEMVKSVEEDSSKWELKIREEICRLLICEEKEKRRIVLPLMKTKLRLIVVHYDSAFEDFEKLASWDY